MILAFTGRKPLELPPGRTCTLASTLDEQIAVRSHRLPAGLFHGMLEIRCRPDLGSALTSWMEARGWTPYPRTGP